MNINWKVRIKNKAFWFALIPGLLLLVSQILGIFGIEFNYAEWVDKILAIVTSLFAVLTIIGVVNDPTTAGLSDSTQALEYNEPKSETPTLERESNKGE